MNSSKNNAYLSIQQATERLGISKRTFRSLLNDPINPIPHFRIGSSGRIVRIKISDLDSWLETFRVKDTESQLTDFIIDLLNANGK